MLHPKKWHNENVVAELSASENEHIFALENNIIVSEYQGDIELDMDKILKLHETINIYTGGVPANHLFIACPELYVNKEARKYGYSDEVYSKVIKSAIVCNNLAHQIIGNFLIKTKKFSKPTKIFPDVDSALMWLREG